jgi:hypothetical protein
MFGLETLDILIGLVTIYLAFAVACTACVELVSAFLNFRSENLRAALSELLNGDISDGEGFVAAFYEHPLVKSLSKGDNKKPSYIPPEIVSKVVESILIAKAGVQDLDKALQSLPDSRAKALLTILLEDAQGDAGRFREGVAMQFDATMDRASGWFKRKTQLVTLCVSILLVVSLNVDTVAIATALAANPQARAALVDVAEQQLQSAEQARSDAAQSGDADPNVLAELESKAKESRSAVDDAKKTLEAGTLPLGWGSWKLPADKAPGQTDAIPYLTKVAGLVLSIFAISLGAPFWFNVLDRFNAVRTTGVREGTAQKHGKQQA